MRKRLLMFAAAAAASIAGCGGTGPSAPVAATEVAMVKSYRFEPQVIEIDAGDTVTWTNEDNFTHTVEVEGREDLEVEQGESVEVTFDEPGSYDYVCTLHSRDMDGTVIVR